MLPCNIYIFNMNNGRRSSIALLCLIALLLWGQSAVAQHDVGHSWHDATELCHVFSSADNAKAALDVTATIYFNPAVDAIKSTDIPSLSANTVAKQTARGPPLRNTTY